VIFGTEQSSQRSKKPGISTDGLNTIHPRFFPFHFLKVISGGTYDKKLCRLARKNLKNSPKLVKVYPMDAADFSMYNYYDTFYLYVCRKKNVRHERFFFDIVLAGVMIPVLGFMTRWETGYHAILLACAAFLIRVLVFDPFRFSKRLRILYDGMAVYGETGVLCLKRRSQRGTSDDPDE